jgi:hypothetical protein
MASMNFTNKTNAAFILATIIVCGLNIFLVTDIAMLLFPALGDVLGRPVRLEYMFGILSFIVIMSLVYSDTISPVGYFAGLVGMGHSNA